MIRLENVCKNFGDLQVLKNVNLEVKEGEKLVIIGPSGSGKSTTVRCMNFLEEPTSGQVYIDGQKLTHANKTKIIRESISMVFQQFNLFPQYKVMDNLTLAPKLALHEQVKAAKKAGQNAKAFKQAQEQALEQNAKSLLERVGLADKADAYPCQLSGGQQQRVLLARALCAAGELLILDEPVTGLDPAAAQELYRTLEYLNKQEGIAIVAVTHDIRSALRYADHILHAGHGTYFFGTAADYLTSPWGKRFGGDEA